MKRFTFLLTVLFCAVFNIQAQNLTLPYHQDFSSLSNGDMLSENGSSTALGTMPTGIASAVAAYEAGEVIRIGEANNAGSITTQPIEVEVGSPKVKVSFRAVPWTGANQLPAKVTLTYGTQVQTVDIPAANNSWPLSATDMETFYNVEFNPEATPTAITVATVAQTGYDSRVFIDDLDCKSLLVLENLNEGFDGTLFPPFGWTTEHLSGRVFWERYTDSSPIGEASASVNWASQGHENYLITPQLYPTSGQNLSFKVKTPSIYSGTTLNVKLSTSGNQISDFTTTALTLADAGITTTWTTYTIDLSSYVGQYIYIAFHVVDNNGLRLMLDDIQGPNLSPLYCPRINNFRIPLVTDNSAVLLWDNTPNYDAIIIECSTSEDFSSDVVVNTVRETNTFTLENLVANTTYYVRAYSDCLAGDISATTAAISFQTPCAAISTLSEDFDSYPVSVDTAASIPNCWSKIITNTSSPGIVAASNYDGLPSQSLQFFGSTPQYVIAGYFDVPLSSLQLEFKLNKETSSSEPFQVGYMSNPSDASTFVPVVTFNDNQYRTLLSKMVLFESVPDNDGANRYIAFRSGGAGSMAGSRYWIDDVVIGPAPTCLPPDSIHTTFVGTDSIEFTFRRNGAYEGWEYVIGSPTDLPSDLSPVAIDATVDTVVVTSLTPNTQYSIWVRRLCEGALTSVWTYYPHVFRTICEPAGDIIEDCENYPTGQLPDCWSKISEDPTMPSIVSPYAYYGVTSKAIRFNGTMPQYLITPKLNAPLNTKLLKFKLNKQNANCGAFQVGYMSDPTDAETFVPIATYNDFVTSSFVEKTVLLFDVPDGGGANRYIAFRYGRVGSITQNPSSYYYVDDIEIVDAGACPPITDLNAVLFGLDSVRISFNSSPNSTSWEYSFDNPSVVPESDMTIVNLSETSFVITELEEDSSYQIWVRGNCGSEGYTDWTTTTYATKYCTARPTSVDGLGITNVVFGYNSASNPTEAETGNYGDYTHIIGDVPKGSSMPVAITYSTGYNYGTKVYVDWNRDFDFFDEGELVYTGTSSSANPTTLNLTITVPNDMPNGEYRMRIVGSYSGDNNPCYSSIYGCVEDYTIHVIDPVTCPTPTAVTVSNITENAADITWTAGENETTWNIVVSTTALDQAALDAATTEVVNTTSYQASALTVNTTYFVYVQADCGATDGVSYWVPVTFRTISTAVNLPYYQDFSGNTSNEIVLTTNSTNSWSIGSVVGNGGNSMYVSKDNGATAEYVNTATIATASVLVNFDNSPRFSISFDWMGKGHRDYNYWWEMYVTYDGMRVYIIPDTLDLSTAISSDVYFYEWLSGTGVRRIGPEFINQEMWTTFTDTLPSSYANTTQRLVFVWINDTYTSFSPTAAVDNISIVGTYCDAPTALAMDSISTDYASIIWANSASMSSWEVEYKANVDDAWITIPAVSDTIAILNNLTPATDYSVRVRAACGTTGQYSAWTYYTFKTQCIEYTIGDSMLRYNFDEYIGSIPDCWTTSATATVSGAVYPIVGTPTSSATDGMLMFRGGNQIISTGRFAEQANTLEVRLWIAREDVSTSGIFEIGVMSDPNNASTFEPVHVISNILTVEDRTFEHFTLSLSGAPADKHYIAFRQTTSQNGLYAVANLDIYVTPTCPAIDINSIVVTHNDNDPTATSVEINWEPAGTEQAWVVQYVHADSAEWVTIDSVNTSSIVITGLEPQNEYFVRVAAVCIVGSDTSFWSPTKWFKTPCAIESLPYSEDFESLSSSSFPPSCWEMRYGLADDIFAGEQLSTSGTYKWEFKDNAYGINSKTAKLNIYGASHKTWLITPSITLEENSMLEFDIALTKYNSASAPTEVGDDDKFMVIVSTDNGQTWSAANATVWNNDGSGNYVLSDVPSTTHHVTIDLSQYSGTIRIAFYGESQISNADNDLYLDNILVHAIAVIPPTVETLAATDITNTSATLNKQVTPGTHPIVSEGFFYQAVGNTTWHQSLNPSITGLTPGTTYKFYAYADVNGTIFRGDTLAFTTTGTAPVPPTVTTEAATDVTQTTATLHKTVVADPSEPIVTQGWKYRKVADNNWTTSIDGMLTGLDHNTQYEFYAFATTANNTAGYNGETMTFTTLAHTQPTVVTGTATNVECNAATLAKTVTPGSETIIEEGWYYRRENTSQWTKTTTATISNLVQNTTYEYYAYAVTAAYPQTEGETLTFTTPQCVGLYVAEYAVHLYPNPATNVVTLTVEGLNQKAEVTIVDIAGKVVGRYIMAQGTNSLNIDVTSFAEGNYIVRIVSDNINTTERIVVKR